MSNFILAVSLGSVYGSELELSSDFSSSQGLDSLMQINLQNNTYCSSQDPLNDTKTDILCSQCTDGNSGLIFLGATNSERQVQTLQPFLEQLKHEEQRMHSSNKTATAQRARVSMEASEENCFGTTIDNANPQ